jgi:predicted acetyltransferase
VTVTIRDARSSREDREWIRAVYHDYVSDLAAPRRTAPSLSAWGIRDDEPLAGWFSERTSTPLVLVDSGRRVGFALVARGTAGEADHCLRDFYVLRTARRRGIGANAAAQIFAQFGGRWEVVEDERNIAALQFWRHVIGALTAGRFREGRRGGEIRHTFRCSEPVPTRLSV